LASSRIRTPGRPTNIAGSDPTFAGLRQIINEPEDRVYIGRIPPKLEEVRGNAMRFIDRLHIRKDTDADNTRHPV